MGQLPFGIKKKAAFLLYQLMPNDLMSNDVMPDVPNPHKTDDHDIHTHIHTETADNACNCY